MHSEGRNTLQSSYNVIFVLWRIVDGKGKDR